MLTTEQFFAAVAKALQGDSPLRQVGGVIEVELDQRRWVLDLAQGTVSDRGPKPDVLVRAANRDFLALVEGRMSVSDGLITERLHVAGDAARAARLFEALAALGAPSL